MADKTSAGIQARLIHLTDPVQCLALGFGAGLSRHAPGTVGSLLALLFYVLFLHDFSLSSYIVWIVCTLSLGVVICDYSGRVLGAKDHPAIVWDEFVGMWVALIGLPLQWQWLLLAFVLFRVLDIFKPPPLGSLERLPHGFGVMLDDFVAGLFVALALLLGRQLLAL